ncbi:L,D-transpeptidase [Mitsuokella jalaludinii]|uniref:L,D-transpeptidase n=1 Tax=Mitsuokella jalaludinii TaxID=187979 RepID=UPI0020D1B1F6|nr:L,D-transpeptidase [Mitsuokella jalaludinii]MCQ1533146.1 L,D-transpeptidase [Mitsuokella jalaludinii]
MWKKVCAGMLIAALLTGAAGTVFAAEANDDVVSLVTQPGQPLVTTTTKTTAAAPVKETAAKAEAPAKVELADRLVINLAARSIAAIRDNQKVALYPIGPGKVSTPTPTGYYKVIDKEVNPTWTDPGSATSIPSGPDNPLGYRWIGIGGNYGIHGTNHPDSVGHYVSNGCIRMHEEDVEKIYDMVEVGTPVDITYNRVVVEKTPDDQIAYYIYPDGYGWQNVTTADVNKWLAGYGVADFVTDADVEQKIQASDGNPTYIAKVYPLYVNGQKLKGKAVVQDDITYLPAVDLAEAAKVSLGWKPDEKVLVSSYGQAVGYKKKDTLYCNADDAATLYHLDGGLNAGKFELKTAKKQEVVPVVENGKSVESGAAKTDAEVYAEATKETAKDVKDAKAAVKDAKAAAKEVKAEAKAK